MPYLTSIACIALIHRSLSTKSHLMITSRTILILATSSVRHSTKMYGSGSHLPGADLQNIQEDSTVIEAYQISSPSVHPVIDVATLGDVWEAGAVNTEVSSVST